LLNEFRINNSRLPIFNKKLPNNKVLPKVLEIRSLIKE